jgi:hypothetical protein
MDHTATRARPAPPALVAALAGWSMMLALSGCAQRGGKPDSLTGISSGGGGQGAGIPFTPFRMPGGQSHAQLDPDEVRSHVMSLADAYSQYVLQSLEELLTSTKDPKKADWARKQRVATLIAANANATGPNPVVSLLDMVVFATLKRDAVQQYWVPNLLADEGRDVLAAHRRGEAEAWATAAKVLTRPQLEQLRTLIEQWRLEHPGQHFVALMRFSDFDAYRNLSPDSPEAKKAGSLFSLFYVDPLAGLDPVARELRSYRSLTERLVYVAARLPMLAAYQVDLAVNQATGTDEIRRFVSSTEAFAQSTDRFSRSVADYPKTFSAERQAAIEQSAKALAVEREAILSELERQDGRIRAIVGDVTRLVERTEQAGTSLNASTAQTVTSTEGAARRTMDHAFRLTLMLLAVVLAGIPLALLGYRMARRHWVDRRGTVSGAGV